MLAEAKFWLGYVVFVFVTFLVVASLQMVEWLFKLTKEPVNPIYLAAGKVCAFFAILKIDEERK